jgi:hypothetical protein
MFQKRLHKTHIPGMHGRRSSPNACQRPAEQRVARGARGGAEVRSSEGMDERHIAEYVSGAWAQVAMQPQGFYIFKMKIGYKNDKTKQIGDHA